MHPLTDAALVELAVRLAREAGDAILAIRLAGFDVIAKSDDSPVTAADHAAEAIIVAGLRAATPSIPVIAEEEMAAGRRVDPGREHWLVDPLDGTRDFAAGHDGFCVNIGLVRDGRAVLGAVGVPLEHAVFAGIVGGAAWRTDATGRHAISARQPPPAGIVVVASRSHPRSARLDRYLAGRPVARIIQVGSAMKFCRIAEGAADLYPRFGRTMEWDTAAPQAVLEAAGGRVTTLDGAPLRYGKPDFENAGFVASGRA